MKVVLYQPQIPQNTGNIGRLCVATQTFLYLVRPIGFFIDSKEIRRSGLDYWKYLQFKLVDTLEEIKSENPNATFWHLTKRGEIPYTAAKFSSNDCLVFGSETKGLPQEILKKHLAQTLTIPMWGAVRSLNLATSVGIVLYEAFRQTGYANKGDKK